MVSLRLFSFIFWAAYWVSSLNCVSVSMFLALAIISRQISLKTRSAHPILASSISSLHAVKRTSSMLFKPSFCVVVGFYNSLLC